MRAVDKTELEALLPGLERRARHAAASVVRNPDVVDEAAAHAIARAWEHHAALKRKKVFSWVGAVAHNWAIDEVRRQGRQVELQAETGSWPRGEPRWMARLRESAPPRSPTDQVAYQHAFQAALDLLPPKLASTMRLAARDLPYRDIARRLRISEGAARKRLHDAKELLRDVLGDDVDWLVSRQYGQ